jgi:pimeloyl-[acyl-carrier protein] methyl ester esterase
MAEPFALQTCRLAQDRRFAWRETGTGQPLVMLHGWSMSSTVFSEVALPLGKYFRVLCPDLPGHGGSDSVPECSLGAMAGQLEAWFDFLRLPEAALLGWSLGGQIAMQLALQDDSRFNRLLLVATTPRFSQTPGWLHGLPEVQLRALDRNLGRAYEKTMGEFFNRQFFGENLPKERYREILRFAVRSSHLPEVSSARETLTLLGAADLRHGIGSISLPTQILHGTTDQIIPVAAGSYLAEQIAGAEIHLVPGIGHAPFLSCPEQAIRIWHDFLL